MRSGLVKAFLYYNASIRFKGGMHLLQNGKYVFPAIIEEEMKLMPHVANAMIYGDGQAYNISLVFPDYDFTASWAAAKGVSAQPEDLVANKEFTGYEVPKRFNFLKNDFSVENNMLTQTLKLKRGVVIEIIWQRATNCIRRVAPSSHHCRQFDPAANHENNG